MNMRKVMLMGGALMFAAFCAIMARSMFSGGAATQAAVMPGAVPAEPAGPEVLVATRTLPVGTIVTADAFRYQPWPKDLIQQAYFIKGEQQPATLGSVIRYAVTAGQPLTQGALVKPGDRGFLAAALGPGMRAVTVSVSAQAGVAGFVFPGDRVDLILTSTVTGGGEGDPLRASETIVRNVRVLATDQKTDKSTDADGKTQVTTFSNVTLETTPKLSEKIAVAQTIGTLSLSLRSIADDGLELERQIAAGEVSLPEGADPKAEQKMRLEIASRPNDRDTTLTTGGEVSRYQRSSPPSRPAQATQGPQPAPSSPATAGTLPIPRGPMVTIARGNNVTTVPLGIN